MALQGRDGGGQAWAIDPTTGEIVPVGSSGGTPPSIGGPSPGERDNPTESYPNQDQPGQPPGNEPAPGTPGAPDGPGAPGSPDKPAVTFDWKSYLQDWGFPPDVVDRLDQIFKTYTDPGQASAAALAYIRGTDWYHTTFAGIDAGIKNGLISDEAGYRSYVNNLDQLYQQYYGRNVTSQEVQDFLSQGKNASQIGGHLQGQAYIKAYGNDIQYNLGAFDAEGRATDAELNALGDEQGGLDNTVGVNVQRRLDLARQRMQRIFQGQLASPSLSILQGGGEGIASGLNARKPDVSA